MLVSACGSSDDDEQTTKSADDATIRLWLNGPDTSDELVELAKTEFAKKHPDVKVEFERQQWTGIDEKLTSTLSGKDAPDVIELGNTQAQKFEAGGALVDLTDDKEALGGDDLVQSLTEAGTYDDKFYGVPYYGGARVVFYRKDLMEKSGLAVPTTMDEFIDAGIKLRADNVATTPSFSGIYYPGKYWYASLPFIWEKGGDIAEKSGDQWEGKLDSPESIEGLELVKKIMDEASGAPKDGDETKDYIAFCNNEIGMVMAPGWKIGEITNEKDGCPDMADKIGAFAIPGEEAGTTAPAFLGGSVLAVPAKSEHQDLARDLLAVLAGETYQKALSAEGLLPARTSLLAEVEGDEGTLAQAKAAENSRFVPASENWAAVETSTILPDMLVAIAKGGDVKAEATKANDAIEAKLNGES